MRSWFAVLTVVISIMFAQLGCTSQPPAQTNENDKNQPAQSAASGEAAAPSKPEVGKAGVAKKAVAKKAEESVQPKSLVVAAGTVLTVRLGDSVGSKTSQPGQTFTATLAKAVEVEGETLIAEGASATGTVVDAKPLGRFKGGAVLQLRLDSIKVNGADRPIQTSSVIRAEQGKGKRTAVLAGGGAAVGALIGGLAGGGKGAAIGALTGGGAGTAGAAFTGNKDIALPAESVLSFKLEQPLEVKK